MQPNSDAQKGPVVSHFSEILYGMVDGAEYFTIGFMPGYVVLVGSPGRQFFLNNGNLPLARLHETFRERKDFLNLATVHKETTTDQKMFLDSLAHLQKMKAIDAHSHKHLREFILKCDCPPKRIKDKLKNMGYAHIVERIKFERLSDELISTVEAMEKFIVHTRGKEAREEQEHSVSRSGSKVRAKPHNRPARNDRSSS